MHIFSSPEVNCSSLFLLLLKNDALHNEVLLPLPDTSETCSGIPLPACVLFTSNSTALVSDGLGTLHVVLTSARDSQSTAASSWKIQASHKERQPFLLLSAEKRESEDAWDCVLLSSDALENASAAQALSGSSFRQQCVFTLSWLRLKLGNDGLAVEEVVLLSGPSVPLYCSLEKDASALLLLCDGRFAKSGDFNGHAEDRTSPAIQTSAAAAAAAGAAGKPALRWTQTSEDLTISFKVDDDVRVRDVVCNLQKDEVSLGLSDGTSLLRGTLFGMVDCEGSAWTLEKGL